MINIVLNFVKKNSECEFWVRATNHMNCWLKKGPLSFSASANARAGFKRVKADGELEPTE